MYVVQIFRDGAWHNWGCAANPSVINKYLDLLRLLHPGRPVQVVPPKR